MSITKSNAIYKSTQTPTTQTPTTKTRTQTNTALKQHGGGKKLVGYEICSCHENSEVEKQAAAHQISPTSSALDFKHSQPLLNADNAL